MKTIYQLPTREPPRPEPPWPPGSKGKWPPAKITKMFLQPKQNQYIRELPNTMKKDRKKQDDRLLKRLPMQERRIQERLRNQILSEKLFLAV